MRAKQMRQGVWIALLMGVALLLVLQITGLYSKAQLAVNEAHNAERQYEALEARKGKLQANLDVLATPLGHDAAIRTAFGVARPGEEVIVVVPPTEATTTPQLPWWKRVLNFF